MELTKEQLLQIDTYIAVCGIKYYDVRAEIVDHFANILEQKLDDNPNLDFKKEIENIHRNFSDKGFSKLLKEKTNSVTKIFYKDSLKHLISFFKLPKIIFTGVLFYGLFLLMNLFENKENYFNIVTGFGFFLILLIFRQIYISKKQDKEPFLKLGMNTDFLQLFNFTIISFNSITIFRNSESFLNATYNIIQLGIFVIIFLFFLATEYVFYQNKKLIKEQYPNILV